MEKKYRLVFFGELNEGVDIETAKENLAALLRRDVASLERYFNGERLVLKNDLDYDKALKIKGILEQKGVVCHIESADTENHAQQVAPSNLNEQQPVDKKESSLHENMTAQTIVVAGVAIVVRSLWSLTIGIPFFIVGLLGFLALDIAKPNSDKGYMLLTNMYKWGSCHWFKQVKLETQDYEVDVRKRKIQ